MKADETGMGKLIFKYGSMGSSKTAQALMTRYNYEAKGTRVWLVKSSADTRDGADILRSRIGLQANAFVITPGMNVKELFEVQRMDGEHYEVIIADEAQFFTEEQIWQFREIASDYDVLVICYGLRTDFRCQLFPGSRALFQLADDIDEISSVCRCGRKTVVNARIGADGSVTVQGPQVEIGGNDKSESLCWTCWRNELRANGVKNLSEVL